ncbi:MAG: YkgJ family cysteine cluster protein, partial [Treponema sp.]
VPPDMAVFSSRLLSLNPDDTHTRPLREALPEAIEKLRLVLRFLTPPEPNSPGPDLPSPCPLSA